MSKLTAQDARQLDGATVKDRNSSRVGEVSAVYLDNDTQQPEWVLVQISSVSGLESFVPLAEASMTNGELLFPYDSYQVMGAPSSQGDELSQDDQARLYRHYGLSYPQDSSWVVGVARRPSRAVRLRTSVDDASGTSR